MAKKNMSRLTHVELIAALEYDPDTGAMTRRVKSRRNANRDGETGTVSTNGRRYITIEGKQYIAHRLAWFYVYGKWPENNLAPRDGNYLNLQLSNWAEETQADTTRRSKFRSSNTSGLRGVHYDKARNKWVATINVNYKNKYLGRFDTTAEAGAAYEQARVELLGASSYEVDDLTGKRERSVVRARCRHLWRRALNNAANVTGWASFDKFFAEFCSMEWRHNREIVAVDRSRPIGPGNWQWQETLRSQFDTSTREGRIAYGKAHRQAHPMTYRDGMLRRDFNIDLPTYQRMFLKQGGTCAICNRAETARRNGKEVWLSVDHCHTTGAIRGLLCKKCNNGLGHFQDIPEIMEAAAAYVRRHVFNRPSAPASNVIPLEGKRSARRR